jgi:hypothetical protein
MTLIGLTGGPKIVGNTGTITLPLPDWDNWMQAEDVDETRYVYKADGSGRATEDGVRNRHVFKFGYRALIERITESDVRTLVGILRERTVTFTPRTISDPSEPAETEFICRVIGDIPITRHLTEGYQIEITLEEIDPLV